MAREGLQEGADMVRIASKTLLQDKLRFALSAGGVATSIMLVLLLFGMYRGVNRQITAYIDNTGGEVLIAQEGTRNFLGARSLLPPGTEEAASQVEGVRDVVPIVSQYAVVDVGDRKEFSLIVGYDPARGGGPWDLDTGSASLREGKAIADYAVSRTRGLALGDSVEILGSSYEIAGLSKGTSSWMTGTFFLPFEDAAEILATEGRPSFLLVTLQPGTSPDEAVQRIEAQVSGVTASTRSQIDANDRLLYARILNGPMGFMVLVAFLIGTAVVGLTIYTATQERAREYGTLKAIGIRNRRLYGLVLRQALIATVVGSVLGVLLALAGALAIPALNPRFVIAIEPAALLVMAAVSLLMGSAASLVPARAVARIEPAIAFRRAA